MGGKQTVIKHYIHAAIFEILELFPNSILVIFEDERLARRLCILPDGLQILDIVQGEVCEQRQVLLSRVNEGTTLDEL